MNNPIMNIYLKVLESPHLTQEMCNDIFQKVGWLSLYHIPEKFRTLEMCREAVQRQKEGSDLCNHILELILR